MISALSIINSNVIDGIILANFKNPVVQPLLRKAILDTDSFLNYLLHLRPGFVIGVFFCFCFFYLQDTFSD